MKIEIGPYSNEMAELITEKLLDSKSFYTDLEELLRGDISSAQFMVMLNIQAQSQAVYIKESEAGEYLEAEWEHA